MKLKIHLQHAMKLARADWMGKSDPSAPHVH